MAQILLGQSVCFICGRILTSDDKIFATSGCCFPREDPLWHFCDAGLHWDCYATWPHRPRFARAYFEREIANTNDNPFWGVALQNKQVLVSVNPSEVMNEARIMFAETASPISVPLTDWDQWLRDPEQALDLEQNPRGYHPLEWQCLQAVLPLLREQLPDHDSLLEPIDWEAKGLLYETMCQQEELHQQQEVARATASCQENNERCRSLAEQLSSEGLTCPHCHHHGPEFKYDHQPAHRKSHFICQTCGRSFRPADLG